MKRQRPEAAFQKAVTQFARLHGWRVASFRAGRVMRGGVEKYETPVGADGRGWPDLVCIHEKRKLIIVCELKAGRNKPTPEQTRWLLAFEAAGVPAYIWCERDWDEIETVLGVKRP